MADSEVIISPTTGDTAGDTLLEMANKVSNVLIGQDASAILKPSKTDIINALNDSYRELCNKHDWAWLYTTSTIGLTTPYCTMPSGLQKIIKVYSADEFLLEYPQDNYHNGCLVDTNVPLGRFVITGYTDAGEPLLYLRFSTLPATASYVAKLKPTVLNLDTDFPRTPTEFRFIIRDMACIKLIEQGIGSQDVNFIQGLYSRVKDGIYEMKKFYLPKMYDKELKVDLSSMQGFRSNSIRRRR